MPGRTLIALVEVSIRWQDYGLIAKEDAKFEKLRAYWRKLLGEAALENRAQVRLPSVPRDGFFHLQHSVPTAKFEGRDVILEPRFFVLQVPAES